MLFRDLFMPFERCEQRIKFLFNYFGWFRFYFLKPTPHGHRTFYYKRCR